MIHFNCSNCNEKYHADEGHLGKKIECKECHTINIIAPPKVEPVVEAPKPTSTPQVPKSKGKFKFPSKLKVLQYSVIFIACTLILSGCISGNILALGSGVIWITYFVLKNRKSSVSKAIASALIPTGLAFSALTLMQGVLWSQVAANNQFPLWLAKLDDKLISLKINLDYVMKKTAMVWAISFALAIALAIKRPKWKPVSRLKVPYSILTMVISIITIVTSFTFFSTNALNDTLEKKWENRYNIAYRSKLQQERRALIASVIKEELKITGIKTPNSSAINKSLDKVGQNASPDATQRDSSFNVEFTLLFSNYKQHKYPSHQTLPPDETLIAELAREDAQNTWDDGLRSGTKETPYSPTNSSRENSESPEDARTNEESEKYRQEWKSQRNNSSNWQTERKKVVLKTEAEALNATIAADEAVAGLATFVEMILGIDMSEEQRLMENYLSEAIGKLAERFMENEMVKSRVKRFVTFTKDLSNSFFSRVMVLLHGNDKNSMTSVAYDVTTDSQPPAEPMLTTSDSRPQNPIPPTEGGGTATTFEGGSNNAYYPDVDQGPSERSYYPATVLTTWPGSMPSGVHPGPAATCPICAAMRLRRLRGMQE